METNDKKPKKIKKNTNQNVRKSKNKQADLIEDLKMEIATELGIMEQINSKGWNSVSPRVSGKIGGKIAQRLKSFGK